MPDISNILSEYQNMIGAPSWVAPPALFADTWYNSAMLSSSLDVEVVTWERLQESTQSSATNRSPHCLKNLWSTRGQRDVASRSTDYYHHSHALVPVGPLLLPHDSPIHSDQTARRNHGTFTRKSCGSHRIVGLSF